MSDQLMNQSRSDRQEAICEAPKMTDQGGQSGTEGASVKISHGANSGAL